MAAFKLVALMTGRGVLDAKRMELLEFVVVLLLPVVPVHRLGPGRKRTALALAKARRGLLKLALFALLAAACLSAFHATRDPDSHLASSLAALLDDGLARLHAALSASPLAASLANRQGLGLGLGLRAPPSAPTWALPLALGAIQFLTFFGGGLVLMLEVDGMGDLVDAAALAAVGVVAEAHFDAPWLATNFSELWGRRWNLTVSSVLRHAFHEPVIEGRLFATPPAGAPAGSPGSATAGDAPSSGPASGTASPAPASSLPGRGSSCASSVADSLSDAGSMADSGSLATLSTASAASSAAGGAAGDVSDGGAEPGHSHELRRRHAGKGTASATAAEAPANKPDPTPAATAPSQAQPSPAPAPAPHASSGKAPAGANRSHSSGSTDSSGSGGPGGRPRRSVSPLRRLLACQLTFAVSGLWHELVAFTMTGRTTGGAWFALFAVQAIVMTVEGHLRTAARAARIRVPTPVARALTLGLFVLQLSWLWYPPMESTGMISAMLRKGDEAAAGLAAAAEGARGLLAAVAGRVAVMA
ncbi:hypothetical protein HYH03_010880 [Edaphochlamys debaryana]|uniref:Wax synthase domain-containing protein n=1 Tax=Edaphochlamys debaryana TaxID=47281 RepID=A0A835XVT5_9CHLO|nr:hypothetical protein HYH03_010880 [Edaphochlamys debaryana]|eukprot:KAG2490724.1 hypothetical protein HYH03_010880 [Edaphochlamys debaryana]